jgi:hypothetical protein
MLFNEKKSLAQKEAEVKSEDFFEVADRNESLPKQAQFLAHLLSVLTVMLTIYYFPIGLVGKTVLFLIFGYSLVQWERGKMQFLKDYHKGNLILHDKNMPQQILAKAEGLITASRDARPWLFIFIAGDLIVTIGMWMYTAYIDATSIKTSAIAAKSKVAADHLSAYSAAVKGGYSKTTLTAIDGVANKASTAITIDYLPIVVTFIIAVVVVLAVQGFTFICSQWCESSVYHNQKKKFGSSQPQHDNQSQHGLPAIAAGQQRRAS